MKRCLASLLLLVAPAASAQTKWLDVNGDPLPFADDSAVLDFLRTAPVVAETDIGVGVNRSQKLTLEKDGVRAHGIFRQVDLRRRNHRVGDRYYFQFADSYLFECAAYELSKLLGLDTVPPAVGRKIRGQQGTLQAWVENTTTQKALREETDIPPSGGINRWRWIMQRQNIYIFDNLIYNEDRNLGNILIEPDWKLWMIDHTRAFRRWKELMNPEQVQFAERSLWEKLQALDETEVRAKLQDFLNPAEMRGLIERTGLLVEHIQKLIDDRGEKAVLFTLR